MKLIIDIPEEDYENGTLVNYFNCYSKQLDEIIYDGIPLSEGLEKIKADIQFIADKCLPNNLAEEFEVKGLKTSIEIIDKHITKLKGEQE